MEKNIFFFLLILNLILSCSTTEPPTPPEETKPTLTLELEDASCTETWLQLTAKDLTLPAELTLKRYNPSGDSLSQIFILDTKDSLLYIDSLLPNQTYNFQLSCIWNPASGNQQQVSSTKLPVATMDTTSHNFTFTSWTFGTIGSSVLYDVAIINENNIWAVGEIMIADTSQNGYTTYNAVHWDGSEWELKRIPYYYNGQTFYNGIKAILVFNENDIWFGIASLIHWNGTVYQSISTASFFQATVSKMWGTSSNDFYIVGTSGQIAHFNGTSWQRIESGTTLNINDIWGDYNEKTQEWEILAVAGNKLQGSENKILRIFEGNTSDQLNSSGTAWPLRTLWFKASQKYYVAGSGVYKKKKVSDSYWKECILDISTYSTNSIRGLNINEIVAVGGFGEVLHFNGYSWKSFINQTGLSSGNYLDVDLKNDLCVAVGQDNSNAVITKGKK